MFHRAAIEPDRVPAGLGYSRSWLHSARHETVGVTVQRIPFLPCFPLSLHVESLDSSDVEAVKPVQERSEDGQGYAKDIAGDRRAASEV